LRGLHLNLNILVCAVYNPSNVKGFSIFGSESESLIFKYSDVLILGDFNNDVLKIHKIFGGPEPLQPKSDTCCNKVREKSAQDLVFCSAFLRVFIGKFSKNVLVYGPRLSNSTKPRLCNNKRLRLCNNKKSRHCYNKRLRLCNNKTLRLCNNKKPRLCINRKPRHWTYKIPEL
jgi:hypothetical protein